MLNRSRDLNKPVFLTIKNDLSLEIGDYNLPGVPSSAELIRSVIEQGYDAFEYRDGTFVRHRLADHYRYDNLIFMPSSTSA